MEQRFMDDEITLDLRQIFAIIRKYIFLILGIPTIAVLVAGTAVFFVVEPIYRAETTLLVRNQTAAIITHADLLASRQLVRTYREIARSRSVADEVIRDMGLTLTSTELRAMVDVSLRGDTEIIAISVEHPSPHFAAQLANAVAAAFTSHTLRVMEVENVTVVDTAEQPDAPVSPRKLLTIVVAGFAGGMAGVGMAFVLSYLDNTFKRPEDIQDYLGLPVLGAIPSFKQQDFVREQVGA